MNRREQRSPLKCWDIYAMHLLNQAEEFTRQIELDTLKAYKKKYGWVFDFDDVFYSTVKFETIILTDANRNIEWVNKGFTKMTGYAANYAKGRKPSFLQGTKTSKQTLDAIRLNLNAGINFKETILNYRKNGTVYNCNIEIYPLRDAQNNMSHYLALEKEIRI
ncbi:MAG: PAS domain-containing protein [Algibacter sp.]